MSHTCTCKHSRKLLSWNQIKQFDPTRTITLRRAYVREMDRRFRDLKKKIRQAIVEDDVFGLEPQFQSLQSAGKLVTSQRLGKRAFRFDTNPQKVDGFMKWLKKESDKGILEIIQELPGDPDNPLRTPWQNVYIDSAYRRGMRRSVQELNKELQKARRVFKRTGKKPEILERYDFSLRKWPKNQAELDTAFLGPVHAGRVANLYVRNFEALKGITAAMADDIRSSLAESLAEGRNPRQAARILEKRVDAIGLNRARTLARTEIIRAHHLGMVQTYREAELVGVRVRAEWATAGDDRVCPDCAFMDGRVFTLDEVEGLIPAHPNCRCVALPYLGKKLPAQPTQRDRAARIGDRYLDAKGRYARRGWYEKQTDRALPDAPKPKVKRTRPAAKKRVRTR